MKACSQSLSVLLGGLWMAVLPAYGHHSLGAEYVLNQPITLNGRVTKVEWSNPHIWFYGDAKDDSGNIVNWGFSGGPPAVIARTSHSARMEATRAGSSSP